MVIQRYQDLDAWQLANELKQKVYTCTLHPIDNPPKMNDYSFSHGAPGGLPQIQG